MLSDDDFYSAEIEEMKNENPELDEYDRVFRKIKEALTIEIQTTKTKLFEKIHELNNKTEHQFNQLYNSCDKRVRRFFDSKHNKKAKADSFEDSSNNNTSLINSTQTSNINTDKDSKNRKKKEKTKSSSDLQLKEEEDKLNASSDEKISNNNNNASEQEYSDDVIFGFLVGSEEESEFLD